MATLKGQNFRIFTKTSTTIYNVVGMATNCTVTLTNNTEDGSHKDIVGMFASPVVTSQSWQVTVESLSVSDVGAMLTAIKSRTPFILMWDEASVADNRTPLNANVCRQGNAYLSDVTFNFDDRAFATKSLQFSGIGALGTVGSAPAIDAPVTPAYTKGQYVRLFLGNDNTATPYSVIAAAKQLSLHVSMSLELASTKDTTGDWTVQEPTGISYDISTTALMRSGDTITSLVAGQTVSDLETIYENGTPVKWQIANVSGDNNRTKGAVIVSGSVILQTLTLNGPNRQNADYTAQLNGYGDYTVGS